MANVEMTAPAPRPASEDARRARILEGATRVFLAYGFQRTTMDDIARAAEVSRPALYLQFRNKTDIYRALAKEFLDRVLAAAREGLAREAPLSERLFAAVECALDKTLEIEASPHGADILDMKTSLAADIVTAGRAEFHDLVCGAIGAAAAGRGIDLSAGGWPAATLADILLDALDGMKLRGLPAARQLEAARAYVGIVAGAIEARATRN
jgi:AcrR family transcriptional regulator